MRKFILAGALVLAVFTAVNARQTQPGTPGDMNHMMQMKQMMDHCVMNMKDVEISVADTADGIVLTLKPKDAAQLEVLRKQVRERVEMMQKMMGNSHNH